MKKLQLNPMGGNLRDLIAVERDIKRHLLKKMNTRGIRREELYKNELRQWKKKLGL